MKYLSLFSGIEAASVAWADLDLEPVAFCEIDKFPSAVLAHHFPNIPNLGDITRVDWHEFKRQHGTIDVIVGGSPCQSFSIAGGRESLGGESRLMFEYIRAVQDIRPRWLLWENVPGVLSTKDNAFGQLLAELEKFGYGLAWRVLDAQFFGVAQRRRRVFLVGYLGNVGGAAAVLFEPESVRGNTKTSKQKRKELARTAERSTRTVCMTDTQTKTTIGETPNLTAHSYKDPPVICVADDQANSTIDVGIAGSLKVGGGRALNSKGTDYIDAICARDFKGVGSQYVDEGKIIIQEISD